MSRFLAVIGALVLIAAGAFVLVQPPRATAPSVTPAVAASPTVAASPSTGVGRPNPTPEAIPPGYRVQIPRLGIDLAILEGDIERDTVQLQTPENYAFHLPGTAIPGTGANSYIYAHARRGMFLSLWNVRVGDEVWISTPDGRALRYVVREIHPRVAPDDVQWAAPTPPDRLTLQTSTGANPGDPRFVVVAQPG